MIEEKYDTFWSRFSATIIDGLVLGPITILLEYLLNTTGVLLLLIVHNLTFYAYTITLHGLFGQTLGKYLFEVKVLTLSETKISFKNVFLRDAVPLFLTLFLLAYIHVYFSGFLSFASSEMPNAQQVKEFDQQMEKVLFPMFIFSLTSAAWLLLELITMLTNNKRRAFHDFIAGTVVVK